MIEELISRVFATRDAVHIEHWKTKGYAAHVALGAFYDGLVDSIDTIVEAYIGMFGDLDKIDLKPVATDDIVAHIGEEMDWLEMHRDDITNGSQSLGNLVDGLTNLYSKTVFLLRLK